MPVHSITDSFLCPHLRIAYQEEDGESGFVRADGHLRVVNNCRIPVNSAAQLQASTAVSSPVSPVSSHGDDPVANI